MRPAYFSKVLDLGIEAKSFESLKVTDPSEILLEMAGLPLVDCDRKVVRFYRFKAINIRSLDVMA